MSKQGGFTLIETVMATVISSLILSMLVASLYQMNALTYQQHSALNFSEQIQDVATLLGRDTSGASRATVSADAATLSLYITVHAFGDAADPGSEQVVTYTYSAGARALSRSEGGSSLVIARNLSGAQFSPVGTTTDQVQLRLALASDPSHPGTLTLRLQSAIGH
jgi:prepilin-type N-terminal cleavage/methylation domain-containing protein